MIYKIKKTILPQGENESEVLVFEVDDNVFLNKQPKKFKDLFLSLQSNHTAEFDNCHVMLYPNTGRLVVTEII